MFANALAAVPTRENSRRTCRNRVAIRPDDERHRSGSSLPSVHQARHAARRKLRRPTRFCPSEGYDTLRVVLYNTL